MMLAELLLAGAVPQMVKLLVKLTRMKPKHWVGNVVPNKKHFDRVDHFDCGAHLDTKTIWVEFDYTEDGVEHTLRADMPAKEVGQRNDHDILIVDGLVLQDSGECIISKRIGWLYTRVVIEFYFGGTHIRFDGDLG